MGMDYRYAGSSSYPRFNDEIKGIVELFGGKMTTARKPENECNLVEYFMEAPLSYEMPEGTPEVFTRWVNNPYDELNEEDTKAVYNILKTKMAEVEKISNQIAYEFNCLHDYGNNWYIS